MYCVIQFYVQLRVPLAEHNPFLKVLAIKLVIFLSFWQTAAISVGTSTLNLVKPGDVLAYPDIKVGIPSLLLCFEMALFAVMHLWAFPWRPYGDGAAKPSFYPAVGGLPPRENEHLPKRGGPLGLGALWDALNVWDVVKAFGRGMRWLFVGVKHRHEDVSYQAARKNSALGGGVDMDDLSSPLPGGQGQGLGQKRFGGDTAYGGSAMGMKSTDHLPIATEFRRSRFGIGEGQGSDEVVGAEHAGLIAHAQENPRSPGRPLEGGYYAGDNGRGGYGDGGYGRREEQPYEARQQPYEVQQEPHQQQQQQGYPVHERRSSLSTVDEETYSRAGSSVGQYGFARGNPRNSTQLKVGNALWGGAPPGQR